MPLVYSNKIFKHKYRLGLLEMHAVLQIAFFKTFRYAVYVGVYFRLCIIFQIYRSAEIALLKIILGVCLMVHYRTYTPQKTRPGNR